MDGVTFATASKKKAGDVETREYIELPINGEMYYAYEPSPNSIAMFYAAIGSGKLAQQLAEVREFLNANVEPAAVKLLEKAVRDDTLNVEVLMQLCMEIIREFAENPTGSPDESLPSPPLTGRAGTASSRRPASTRASSPARGSSGRSTTSSRAT